MFLQTAALSLMKFYPHMHLDNL